MVAIVWQVTAHGPSLAAPITGLSHVQLWVSDLGASAQWYAVALGLEPQAEDASAGYVALRHRGASVIIVLTSAPVRDTTPESGTGPVGLRPTLGQGSLDHLAFAVPDGGALRAWADHLNEIGIRHAGVVLENGNPSLQLRDPDGNAIELVAPGRRRS